MDYGLLEIICGVGGAALSLAAAFALNPDGVSRVTEALLDRIEVRLALRRQRRAAPRRDRVSLPLTNAWQEE
jgi:hypothetical protein